ncbi:MAG: NAD(P)H-binding protein [Halioglobus sp.]
MSAVRKTLVAAVLLLGAWAVVILLRGPILVEEVAAATLPGMQSGMEAKKILVLGATGNSGQRLVALGMARGHQVTAYVRNLDKLRKLYNGQIPADLTVIKGDVLDPIALRAAMLGQDVVINAAGNLYQGENFVSLVSAAIEAADEVLGAGGRFWLFGGAAILEIPATQYMLVDSPLMPEIFQAHRKNYEKVKATQLDWSMFSPGPMTAAENGKAHEGLRVTADSLPVEFPAWARLVPKTAWPLFLRLKMPELVISYEDAAKVIFDNLDVDGPLSKSKVGVALPPGMTRYKEG